MSPVELQDQMVQAVVRKMGAGGDILRHLFAEGVIPAKRIKHYVIRAEFNLLIREPKRTPRDIEQELSARFDLDISVIRKLTRRVGPFPYKKAS